MRKLVLLLGLLGCSPQPRDSFVLRVAMWGPLGTVSPTGEGNLASVASPWVFEKAAGIDDSGQLRPVLVDDIARDSGSRLRLTLRKDSTFSDGSPIAEADVIRSLSAAGLRAEARNGTLLVESQESTIPAEALLSRAVIFREVNGQFLGSGPFVVAEQTEHEIRLVRRKPERGHINEVRLVEYASSRDAFSHTLKGDANLVVDLEPRWREFFDGVPSLRVVRTTGHNAEAIAFNLEAMGREERLRLAAILESEQVRQLAYGEGKCAESGLPQQDSKPLPPGRPLNVVTWGPFERLGLAARRALGERAGDLVVTTPPDALARLTKHQFDLITLRPPKWPPIAMVLTWRTGAPGNIFGYSNKAVDDALDAGDWAAAEAALRDDPPAAFVCTREYLIVVDARIKNPMVGPSEILETLPDWEVAQ